MRALLSLALLVFAPTLSAQDFWGPACILQVPEGYTAVEAGQGWGYTVDLVPITGEGDANLLRFRLAYVLQAESANSLLQQYWQAEGARLAQLGWELVGPSEPIKRTIHLRSAGEFEEDEEGPQGQECIGQRLDLKFTAEPERIAEMQLFAWQEANGSYGLICSFAEDEAQKAAVEAAIEGLSTSGINAAMTRRVHVNGIGFSVPLAALHEVIAGEAGTQLLRIARAEGMFEILIGPSDPANASFQAGSVLSNSIARLAELEKQGLGKRGASRLGWLPYRNDLLDVHVVEWTQQGTELNEIYMTSTVMNGHPVLLQTQPNPGQGAALGGHLLKLLRTGISVPGSRQGELWNAVQFREFGVAIPRRMTADWQPLLDEAGLMLRKRGLDMGLWMGCFDYQKQSELPQQLQTWLRAHLEQQGVAYDADRLQLDMIDIYPPDDFGPGFGDPLPVSVPRVRYLDEASDQARLYTACLHPFRDSCAVAILHNRPADQFAADHLLVETLQRAAFDTSRGSARLQYIHRSHFPLRYPGSEFVAWSQEDSTGSSSARLFHAQGEIALRTMQLSEVSSKSFGPFEGTSGLMRYEKTARIHPDAQFTSTFKGTRMIGGQLVDWHGFHVELNGEHERVAGAVWKEGSQRLRILTIDRSESGSQSELLASFDRCMVQKVVGQAGGESLPQQPIPFGGMWLEVPQTFAIRDTFGPSTGIGMAVVPPNDQDWMVLVQAFLVDESQSDEHAFDMLWAADTEVKWAGDDPPVATPGELEWLGGTAKTMRRSGKLIDGQDYSSMHVLHRDGRVCRSWSVHGVDGSFDGISELLAQMRSRAEIAGGLVAAPPEVGKRRTIDLGGLSWEISADFLEMKDHSGLVTIEGSRAFENNETFCQLYQYPIPAGQPWTQGLVDFIGLRNQAEPISLAEAKRKAFPMLLEVHGRLRPTLGFELDGFQASLAIVPLAGMSACVMTMLSEDPSKDLVQALHGWPRSDAKPAAKQD